MKKLSSIILVLLLTIPTISFAQDNGKVMRLEEGTSAPYAGLLLDDVGFATLMAKHKEELKLLELELKFGFAIKIFELQQKVDMQKVLIDTQEEGREALAEEYKKLADKQKYFDYYLLGGFVSGAAVVALIVYLVK